MEAFTNAFLQRVKAPETVKTYQDVALAALFILLSELLIVPIQLGLDSQMIEMPASMLVMLLTLGILLLCSARNDSVEVFFKRWLKGPIDLIGRHMSFAFVVSFSTLSRDHISDAVDIGRIAGCFAVTTVISYLASYLLAFGSFAMERNLRYIRVLRSDSENSIAGLAVVTLSQEGCPQQTKAMPAEKHSAEDECQRSRAKALDRIIHAIPSLSAFGLIWTVGLPVYCATGYDMPIDMFCLVLFWSGTASLQQWTRSWAFLEHRLRIRVILTPLINPVLLTAAIGAAYILAKAHLTNRDFNDVLTGFQMFGSWAQAFRKIAGRQQPATLVGAGDLITALLDAGTICLAFKIFEYRQALWLGLGTTIFTSASLAVVNVFVNVPLAREIGLQSDHAAAFAARSVTIALGTPAVTNLGGSTSVMSVLVICNGILFQIMGDWMYSVVGIKDDRGDSAEQRQKDSEHESSAKAMGCDSLRDGKMVAAGITAGINAAAMGTAHLIEQKSRSVAYAALAMTMFGAFTVAITAMPAISTMLIQLARR